MSEASASEIRIGTRESQLAMVQTTHVRSLLQAANPSLSFAVHGMTTTGDQIQSVALSKIGSKSLFTKELEVALHDKTVDLVVHSLKDLPTTLPEGMVIGAILEREDPRDAVVFCERLKGKKLKDFVDQRLVIGTSSVRRSAQLKKKFPLFEFKDVRGNLNTRLRKLDDPEHGYDALLLAHAGMHRLGWNDRISEILNPDTILHAVGQGALGVECREGDSKILDLLSALDHTETRIRCTAERAFMRRLEGGCSVPLGVWTSLEGQKLSMIGSVTSLDGAVEFKTSGEIFLPEDADKKQKIELADGLGRQLADDLISQGAGKVLDELKASRASS